MKVKGWKKISCIWKGKKCWVSIPISNKRDFKIKAIVTDKEHYIMTKESNKRI